MAFGVLISERVDTAPCMLGSADIVKLAVYMHVVADRVAVIL